MDIRGALINYVYLLMGSYTYVVSNYAIPLMRLLSLYAFPTSKSDMSGWISEGHS